METPGPSQHSPILWGIDEPEPVLHGVSVDGERQRSQLHEEEPRGQ